MKYKDKDGNMYESLSEREQSHKNEEWRNIPGETGYQVSSCGRVRSMGRVIMRKNGRRQTVRERVLKAALDEWGYLQVRVNGKTYKVHRLVALAFLPKRKYGLQIRHLDGNPANNSVGNLTYGTGSQNVLDMYDYRGIIRKNQKLTETKAADIKEMLRNGKRNREIALEYGVSEQTICDIKHGRIYARVAAGK